MSSIDELNRKTISDKWMELIYDSLQKLNLAYLRLHEGCDDLIEYCQTSPDLISKVQYKNAGFMITYFKNIISNASAVFKPEEYAVIKGKIEFLDKFHSQGVNTQLGLVQVFEIYHQDQPKVDIFRLTSAFNFLVVKLDEVYDELVKKLQPILFIEGNIKNR